MDPASCAAASIWVPIASATCGPGRTEATQRRRDGRVPRGPTRVRRGPEKAAAVCVTARDAVFSRTPPVAIVPVSPPANMGCPLLPRPCSDTPSPPVARGRYAIHSRTATPGRSRHPSICTHSRAALSGATTTVSAREPSHQWPPNRRPNRSGRTVVTRTRPPSGASRTGRSTSRVMPARQEHRSTQTRHRRVDHLHPVHRPTAEPGGGVQEHLHLPVRGGRRRFAREWGPHPLHQHGTVAAPAVLTGEGRGRAEGPAARAPRLPRSPRLTRPGTWARRS